MKFGKLFKREKTQPKSEETHPPEETIACPYCGHRYWTKSMAISGILARNHTSANGWLGSVALEACKPLGVDVSFG
jgi:hypothetical protein